MTFYAHNSQLLVRVRQQVEQGQQISEMGSTGYSTGPHLHFEVHPNGRAIASKSGKADWIRVLVIAYIFLSKPEIFTGSVV